MAKPGRPRLQLDEGLIERLAMIHCPLPEIAAALDCSVDTLERNYAAIITKGREKGKLTLRRIQWEAAQKGNIVMMIWLGKQLLHQVERTQIELSKIPDEILIQEAQKRLGDGQGQGNT